MCDRTPECKSILYATRDNIVEKYRGYCWPKTVSLQNLTANSTIPVDGFNVYLRNDTPKPSWIEFDNKYVKGHDVAYWNATYFNSSQHCQKACDANQSCKSILYATQQNIIS